jgi:hypothetical protein
MSIRSAFFALLVAGALTPTSPSAAQVTACPGTTQAKTCVFGFSKNICKLSTGAGSWSTVGCTAPPVTAGCRSLAGRSVALSGPITNNGQTCNSPGACPVGPGQCDELPLPPSTIVATIDLNAQRSNCCPGRGSWGGKWSVIDNATGVTLVSGRLDSTMGVGTHRATNCAATGCSKTCERCYDATFDAATSTWRLASEGFVTGTVAMAPFTGCVVRASFQGDWTANGDAAGPLGPLATTAPWSFCGTIDGVVECPCS